MIDPSQIKVIEGRYYLHNGENKYPCVIFSFYDEKRDCLWYCVKGLYRIESDYERKKLKKGDLVVIMGVRPTTNNYGEIEEDINTKEEFSEKISIKIMRLSPQFHDTLNIIEQTDLYFKRYEEEKQQKEERLIFRNNNPKPSFNSKLYKGSHKFEQYEDPKEQEKYNKNLDYELLTCSLYNHQLKGGVIKNNYYSQTKLTWFCKKGFKSVVLTPDSIEDNTDLEYISTRIFCKSEDNINSLEDLENVVLTGINEENNKFKRIKIYTPMSRFDFGKYDDWTLLEVIKIDPDYINWCVINNGDFIYTPNLENFQTFKEFSLSLKASKINDEKSRENEKIYTRQMRFQRFSELNRRSSWVDSDENTFDSLTDGQYGSYDDFDGDIDRLKDGLGY